MADAPTTETMPNQVVTPTPTTPVTHAARVAEAAKTLAAQRAGKVKAAEPEKPVVAEKATTPSLGELAADDKTAKTPIVEEKPPEPKPDELTPKLAAIAREDARILRAKKDLETREAALAEREKGLGTTESLRQRFATDIAGLAEELKLTPDQRKALANELFYSGVPKEQWPAERAGKSAELRTMSEVEQAKSIAAKAAKDLEDYKAQTIKEREQEETNRVANEWTGKLIAAATDETPLVRDFLASEPGMRNQLWSLSIEMAKEMPADQHLTEAMVMKRAEELLSARYPKLKALYSKPVAPVATPVSPAAAKEEQPPNTLTNQRTASPSRAEDAPKTLAERQALAAQKLREARSKG